MQQSPPRAVWTIMVQLPKADSSERLAVILVEPDAVARTIMAAHLREDGYRVFETGECADVLVLLDAYDGIGHLILPGDRSGQPCTAELADRIRRAAPDIQVVLASGINGAKDRTSARD